MVGPTMALQPYINTWTREKLFLASVHYCQLLFWTTSSHIPIVVRSLPCHVGYVGCRVGDLLTDFEIVESSGDTMRFFNGAMHKAPKLALLSRPRGDFGKKLNLRRKFGMIYLRA